MVVRIENDGRPCPAGKADVFPAHPSIGHVLDVPVEKVKNAVAFRGQAFIDEIPLEMREKDAVFKNDVLGKRNRFFPSAGMERDPGRPPFVSGDNPQLETPLVNLQFGGDFPEGLLIETPLRPGRGVDIRSQGQKHHPRSLFDDKQGPSALLVA